MFGNALGEHEVSFIEPFPFQFDLSKEHSRFRNDIRSLIAVGITTSNYVEINHAESLFPNKEVLIFNLKFQC